MVSANSRCSSSREVSNNSLAIPRTPFMGVRTSWLTTATKSDLERDRASASSLAFFIISSARLRSVMSVWTLT